VGRALRKTPGERFASMADAAEALAGVERPVVSEETRAVAKPARRSPWLLPAWGLVIALSALVAVLAVRR
jgi:hypothetical protein